MTDPGRSPRLGGPRPRYVRRVTHEHVGERVSVRHLVDSSDRGPVPTDVVGRLASADDELLLIVDREAQLHVVATDRVLASRVVPAHPRLPAEPTTGTRERPLERDAARVLLLDPSERVLLLAHAPTNDRLVWTAPGGGLRPGEDHERAARRELAEELSVTPPLGPWIWWRTVRFAFRGLWLEQRERWFLARLDGYDVDAPPTGDPGTGRARWWTVEQLAATDAELAPREIAHHLTELLAAGPPAEPVDVGR